MRKIRQYDAGVELEFVFRDQNDAKIDLDGSETAFVYLQSNSGRLKKRTATIDPINDVAVYRTNGTDFDEWDVWRVQAELVGESPLDISSSIQQLEVEPVLRTPKLVIRLQTAWLFFRALNLEGLIGGGSGPSETAVWRHAWGGLINRIHVFDELTAWTAEEGGKIRHTSDGATWLFQSLPDQIRSFLRGIYFLKSGAKAGLSGWAVGHDGYLIKTVDAGTTWEIVGARFVYPDWDEDAGEPCDLWDVFFKTNGRDGWIVGIRTLRRTTDGGATWADIYGPMAGEGGASEGVLPDPDETEIYRLAFFGLSGGAVTLPAVAASEPGLVFASADGDAWTFQIIPKFDSGLIENLELWDIRAVPSVTPSTTRGYLVGGQGFQEGGVLVTFNGGTSWAHEAVTTTPQPGHSPTLYGVTAFGIDGGIAVGYGGRVLRRDIVGDPITWLDISDLIEPPLASVRIPMLSADSDGMATIYLAGFMGKIYKSTDGGDTWERQASKGEYRLRNVFAKGPLEAWAVSQISAIVHTTDGGETFVEELAEAGGTPNLNGISFGAGGFGAAVGNAPGGANPSLFCYDVADNPTPWSPATINATIHGQSLFAVCWVGTECWAVGENNLVLRSVDGHATSFDPFTGPPAFLTTDLLSIAFDGTSKLYVVGYETASGLARAYVFDFEAPGWVNISPPSLVGIWREVVAIDSDVYAIGTDGNFGAVYKLDAGGMTWSDVTPSLLGVPPENLFCGSITGSIGARTLYVGGERGKIYRRKTGIWVDMRSQTSVTLTGMSLSDEFDGFAVGNASLDAFGDPAGDAAMIRFGAE